MIPPAPRPADLRDALAWAAARAVTTATVGTAAAAVLSYAAAVLH